MIWATCYFKFFSHDSFYWESFALLESIVTLTLISMFVPESPKFLYEKGLYSECRNVLNYVAKNNGVSKQVMLTWSRFDAES